MLQPSFCSVWVYFLTRKLMCKSLFSWSWHVFIESSERRFQYLHRSCKHPVHPLCALHPWLLKCGPKSVAWAASRSLLKIHVLHLQPWPTKSETLKMAGPSNPYLSKPLKLVFKMPNTVSLFSPKARPLPECKLAFAHKYFITVSVVVLVPLFIFISPEKIQEPHTNTPHRK